MKLIALPLLAAAGVLVVFPALFATGDPPGSLCAGGDVTPILATIRTLESGGDYTAQAHGSTASGAYQFIDATWNHYDGYPHAWQAPPGVQDAKAADHIHEILDAHHGDVTAVPVAWYIGHIPPAGSPEWDRVPAAGAGNTLTPRQYQQRWLSEYDRHQSPTGDDPDAVPVPSCAGGATVVFADGFAPPVAPDLFARAAVDEPHHDYPAWDGTLPVGTPVYAIRGGRVVTVQYWPHNWWDTGCDRDPTGCHTCGIGVTIQDDTGTRWAYCHGSTVTVTAGTTIAAGTQILTSGNTGRSSGPHLHIQIRTPDGQLRCPQPLLQALRDHATGIDPDTLPTAGCTY